MYRSRIFGGIYYSQTPRARGFLIGILLLRGAPHISYIIMICIFSYEILKIESMMIATGSRGPQWGFVGGHLDPRFG